MVKITDPNNKAEELTTRKKKTLINQYMEDPTTRQTKKMKIMLRLTPAVEQQLRQYAEVKGTTVTDAVEQIVTKKFHNKKINRQYFNLQQSATILLPRRLDLLNHYRTEQINMVAHITETSNEAYNINFFDKQAALFTNHPEDLKVVTLHQVNNAFDVYSDKEECYFTTYGLQKGENELLNHVGLVMIELDVIDEEATTKTIRIPLFVHTYDGILREAIAITKEDVITLAERYHNPILKETMQSPNDVAKFEEIGDMITLNKMLKNIVNTLEQENERLHTELQQRPIEVKDNKELQKQIEQLQEENRKYKAEFDNLDNLINKITKEKVDEALATAKQETLEKVLATYELEKKT